jgi:hypothetical protein
VTSRRQLLAFATFTIAFSTGASAFAFCRTTTCDPNDPKQMCSGTPLCPVTSGRPLFWKSLCVSFGVHELGSPLRGISFDQSRSVVTDGFLRWLNIDCGGGAPPGLQISDFGAISCDRREYNSETDGGNANVWIFRDDEWPYETGSHTLALTTITFEKETGEIFDADVELNSAQNNLTIDTDNPAADLPSIVTHEAGHFLGLSHTQVEGATMVAVYRPGNTDLRTLEADDIAGMCAIYPPNRDTVTTSCEPRHGFLKGCYEPTEDKGCSTVSPGRHTKAPSAPAGLFGLLAIMLYGFRRSTSHRIRPSAHTG